MRGEDRRAGGLFSYVDLEARVPAEHPLRPIRAIVDAALSALSGEFEALYSHLGRPSIPPERLLRALLLQAFYSVRSERLLMEQLDYNLLFRWFVGLGIDDPIWHPTAFTTNRDRLLEGAVAARFLAAVLDHARVRQLLSREHFSVDGTLIEAWASMKSFRPRDGADQPPGGGRNRERDFHGERRRNATHASTTDAEARLCRKGAGKEAKLCFMGHLLMENHSGLVVATRLTQATGLAEREAASGLIADLPGRHRITVGADRAYDTRDFVAGLRRLNATPHLAQNVSGRRSRIDRRTVRHPGYLASQRARKRIEEAFAWIKTIAGQAKTAFRGTARVGWAFTLAAAAYNLIRLPKLLRTLP
jgi:transposase